MKLILLFILMIPLGISAQDHSFNTQDNNRLLTEITQSLQGYIANGMIDDEGNQVVMIQPSQTYRFESLRVMVNLVIDLQGAEVTRPWARYDENYLALVRLNSDYIGLVYNTEQRVLALIEYRGDR